MMNADQTQSISAEREAMIIVFAELRAAKFCFPREWEVPNGEHDPAPGFEGQPKRTQAVADKLIFFYWEVFWMRAQQK